VTILEHLAFMEVTLVTEPQSFASWVAIEHLRRIRAQFLAGERPPGRPPVPVVLPIER
jgi:hypothetical protein